MEVVRLTREHVGEVAAFLEPRAFHHWAAIPGVDRGKLARHVAGELAAAAEAKGGDAWAAMERRGGRSAIAGVAGLAPDRFYTRYFGLASAKGTHFHAGAGERDLAAARRLAKALADGSDARADHAAVRVAEEEHAASVALEEAGFRRRDTLVDWWIDLRRLDFGAAPRDVPMRTVAPGDKARIAAAVAGMFDGSPDRFARDPAMPLDAARRCFETWILNSLDGFADDVVVAEVGGEVAGVITLDYGAKAAAAAGEPIGDCPIGGVTAAARGRGVYRALLAECGRRFQARGLRVAIVTGQIQNRAVVGTWAKLGFAPLHCRHTLTRSRPGISDAGTPSTP